MVDSNLFSHDSITNHPFHAIMGKSLKGFDFMVYF